MPKKCRKVYTYDLRFGGKVNLKNIQEESKRLGLKPVRRGKFFVDVFKCK